MNIDAITPSENVLDYSRCDHADLTTGTCIISQKTNFLSVRVEASTFDTFAVFLAATLFAVLVIRARDEKRKFDESIARIRRNHPIF